MVGGGGWEAGGGALLHRVTGDFEKIKTTNPFQTFGFLN